MEDISEKEKRAKEDFTQVDEALRNKNYKICIDLSNKTIKIPITQKLKKNYRG